MAAEWDGLGWRDRLRAIADLDNARLSVRQWEAIWQLTRLRPLTIGRCVQCGGALSGTHGRRYCSAACRQRAYNRRKKAQAKETTR
jgi:hypothetical protein